MLKTLRIKNFQKHDKLEIEFDANITTIVGASDRGKSAIFRALRWLCLNNPSGEEFIKYGTKGTTVQLELIDGQTITRKRGKSTNSYHLGQSDYKSFGTGVPDPIANALRVDQQNFQQQHDPAFWLSLSPGEVSRSLNQVVDLGVIDESLSNITKKVRYYQQAAQISKDRLAKARSRKDDLAWVVEVDADYQIVEECEAIRTRELASAAALGECVANVVSLSERRQNAILKRDDVNTLGRLAKTARDTSEDIRSITHIVNSVSEAFGVIEGSIPDFGPVETAYVSIIEIENDCKSLSDLLNKVEHAFDRLVEAQKATFQAELNLSEAMQGGCPVCGRAN